MRKFLMMSFMLLGSITLFAQFTPTTCYTFTNTLNCELKVCAMVSKVCPPNYTGTIQVPFSCTVPLAQGATGTLCVPIPSFGGCFYSVTQYMLTFGTEQINIMGNEVNTFTNFLNGSPSTYKLQQAVSSGPCSGFVKFTKASNGTITVARDDERIYPCGQFCFKNETGCYYISFCVSSALGEMDDPCTPEIESEFTTPKCISLGDGTDYPLTGCIDFGINPETGCYWCPKNPAINVCSLGGQNNFCFSVGPNGGQGMAKCLAGETPFPVVLILENGIYVLRRL